MFARPVLGLRQLIAAHRRQQFDHGAGLKLAPKVAFVEVTVRLRDSSVIERHDASLVPSPAAANADAEIERLSREQVNLPREHSELQRQGNPTLGHDCSVLAHHGVSGGRSACA